MTFKAENKESGSPEKENGKEEKHENSKIGRYHKSDP